MRNLGGHNKCSLLKATVKPTLPVQNVPNSYRKVGTRHCAWRTSELRGHREQTEALGDSARSQPTHLTNRVTSNFYPTKLKRSGASRRRCRRDSTLALEGLLSCNNIHTWASHLDKALKKMTFMQSALRAASKLNRIEQYGYVNINLPLIKHQIT